MAEFQFIGGYQTVYPNIILPGQGSLSVEPGEIRDLDSPPDDGQWIPVSQPEPAAPAARPASPPAKVTDVNA